MDPIRFDAGDTNLFRYVGNNPINGTDSSGKTAWEWATCINPVHTPCCCWAVTMRYATEAEMANRYGPTGNADDVVENAIKHCTWMCATASNKWVCTNRITEIIGWSHEQEANPTPAAKAQHKMDLHNNEVGISFSSFFHAVDPTPECADKCEQAAIDGKLTWIAAGPPVGRNPNLPTGLPPKK